MSSLSEWSTFSHKNSSHLTDMVSYFQKYISTEKHQPPTQLALPSPPKSCTHSCFKREPSTSKPAKLLKLRQHRPQIAYLISKKGHLQHPKTTTSFSRLLSMFFVLKHLPPYTCSPNNINICTKQLPYSNPNTETNTAATQNTSPAPPLQQAKYKDQIQQAKQHLKIQPWHQGPYRNQIQKPK